MEDSCAAVNKICAPDAAGTLPRTRLFALLDASNRPIMWIQGPGGAGKSTLAASYLKARNLSSLWYCVDERDADIASLFYYLGMAVRKASPDNPAPLPLLTPEYQLGIAAFSRRFFEEMFRRLPRPFALVLDDYQDVPEGAGFHQAIRAALLEVPPGIRVFICSRQAPPPPLVRLRAQGKMALIGWPDLRLTAEETADILHLHAPSRYERDMVEHLHIRTHGWVSGLVLLLEGGRFDSSTEPLKEDHTLEEVFDYFAGELFERSDPEVRDLLLRASLLPEVLPRLVEAVTENRDAARILAELHRKNCFTELRPGSGVAYSFHPLFRAFLLSRARQKLPAAEHARVRRTAGKVLEEIGRPEQAIELLLAAGDWDGVAPLIQDNARLLIHQGRNETVTKWLESLPSDVLARKPYLLFWLGVCKLPVNPQASRSDLEKAFSLFRVQGDRAGLFLSWCAVVDTAIHVNEYAHIQRWIEVLDDLRREDTSFPSLEIEVRVDLSLFNAVAFGRPDHPEIRRIRDRAFALVCTEKVADANLYLNTGVHLVVHFIYQGDFTRAGIVLNHLQESARSKEVTDLALITLKLIEAHYAFATCALDTCMMKASEALDRAARSGIHLWNTHLYGYALAAALAKGDHRATGEFMAKMSAGLENARPVDRGYYYWLKAWDYALREKFPECRHLQELVLEIGSEVGFLAPKTITLIHLAEISLEQEDVRGAAEYLETALPLVQGIDSAYLTFYHSMIEAYLHFKCGDEDRGIALLGKAFRLGRECHIENFYFWRPALMIRLCMKSLAAGIEVEYAAGLIRKRKLVPDVPPLHIENWPWPVKVHTLGRFGLEVDGKPVTFSGKVQKKPLELLKFIVAMGGSEVLEAQVSDALWPDADGDTAHQALKIALHRLRQLIGHEKAIEYREGRLSLDRHLVWTDIHLFERTAEEARERWKASDGRFEKMPGCAEKALALYRGPFLAGDEQKPWVVSARERLKGRFLQLVCFLADFWQEQGEWKRAADCCRQGLEAEERAEDLHRRLIVSYQRAGRSADALNAYEHCRRILVSLGVKPSEETNNLLQNTAGK